MNDASPARHDKFRAYRARKKAAGLREVRMWVLDTRSETFRTALAQQIAAINRSDREDDITAWADEMIAESLSNDD